MSRNTNDTIEVLTAHRNNLAAAQTYEEYRDAHVAYVDMLIESYKAALAEEDARENFKVASWKAVISADGVTVSEDSSPKAT